MVERALRFAGPEAFTRGLELLAELEASGPVQYDLAGDEIVVMPNWVYDRLQPRLEAEGVAFDEVRIVSPADLSPQERARLQGC